MQKRTRPITVSRRLSERAREAGGQQTPETIASLGGTAGDFLGALKDVFEQMTQAVAKIVPAEPGEGGAHHQGDAPFSIGGKTGRMVFGYNMRMGLDGLKAEPFGDIPRGAPAKGAPAGPAARAPIVDVFEEPETIRVVAELPGVAAEDVVCTLQGASLRIATRGATQYDKTITLPSGFDPASLSQTCRNGILEVCLARIPVR